MASHAKDMGDLVSEIMLLHYDRIQDGAQRIASDATLSRPLTNDASELNSALPEKFFLYQDNLRLEARTLAEAAGRQHAFDVADSYGRLSQVCVRATRPIEPAPTSPGLGLSARAHENPLAFGLASVTI